MIYYKIFLYLNIIFLILFYVYYIDILYSYVQQNRLDSKIHGKKIKIPAPKNSLVFVPK